MLVNINEGVGGGDSAPGHANNNNNNNKAAFLRGDKSSVSVRLRTKKTEISNPGNGKKRNRHSGDFSFFSSSKTPEQQQQQSVSPTRGANKGVEAKKGGDWAYITFPNGVPTVQDIKTNVGPVSQREPVPLRPPPLPATAAMLMPGSRASVHLSQGLNGKRVNSDFSVSQFGSVSLDNGSPDVKQRRAVGGVVMRQKPPQQQQQLQQQQSQQPAYRNSCYIEHGPKHVTQVTVTASPQESPNVKRPLSTAAANVLFRRKNQGSNGAVPQVAHSGGVAKRCSGEFDFVRHNRRSSLVLLDAPESLHSDVVRVQVRDRSQDPDLVVNRIPDPSPDQDVPARLPGLGRRAITQINIRHNKKNSYNAAMCKSQENLVKAGVMNQTDDDDLDDSDLCQEDSGDLSLEKRNTSTIKKGLLWQQRDKFFSQWKERYFILTSDYLQCFKKGTSRITEMGEFIYKIKLCELEDVELLDRRGYLVLCFTLQKEGKVYLRRTEGIRDWYNLLKECVEDSKKRRNDRSSKSFWSTKQLTDSSSIEKWLQARKKIGLQYAYLSSDPKGKSDDTSIDTQQVSPLSDGALTKASRSEITLDELSDLYRCEEEEERIKSQVQNSIPVTTSNGNGPSQVVQLRISASRDDLSFKQPNNIINRQTKKINRLSLMSDLELPDLGGSHDLLGIDLEKGIYISGKQRLHIDNDSNDSGNNSMNTNGSVASSNSSHSNHSNPREPRERLETHLESDQPDDQEEIQSRDESRLKGGRRRSRDESGRKYFGGNRRPSSHVMPNGLQVTHV